MKRFALVTACLLIWTGIANAQRRVITNEDIAPAVEAAPTPAPASDAEAASTAAASGDLPRTPLAELARLKAIQGTFSGLIDELTGKAAESRYPEHKETWGEMLNSLGVVIRANMAIIQRMEKDLGMEPSSVTTPEETTQSAPPPAPPAQ